jgi:hypothetical protein
MKKIICLLLVASSSTALMAERTIGCYKNIPNTQSATLVRSYVMGEFKQADGTSWVGFMEKTNNSDDTYNVWTQVPTVYIDNPIAHATVGGIRPVSNVNQSAVNDVLDTYGVKKVFTALCTVNPTTLNSCSTSDQQPGYKYGDIYTAYTCSNGVISEYTYDDN